MSRFAIIPGARAVPALTLTPRPPPPKPKRA